MKDIVLEMKHVTKRFPGVIALKDVSISLKKGEVMAICGENGAGKSTLMKVLSGSFSQKEYEGEIWINGVQQQFATINDAEAVGIEMVYQELNMNLVGSVAENLYVGNLPGKGIFVDWKQLYADTRKVLTAISMDYIDPKTPAGLLNSGQLQMLAIMRAVIKKPKIMVLDEPTSALSENETATLFKLIQKLKNEGVSMLFITHKLDEVFEMADRVTVMRDGAFISVNSIDMINQERLVEEMVGRKVENQYPKRRIPIGEEILRVEHLTVPHPNVKGRNIVEDIGFTLHKGEILGLGGLVGAGRSEAIGAIFGQLSSVSKDVYISDTKVAISEPKDAIKNGIGFLTEERRKSGLIPVFSICHNLTLCVLDKLPGGKFINSKAEEKTARGIFDRLKIKAPSMKTQVINLSGGNQQKVILGKWLLESSAILFMDEPTKGIDVGAKAEIYTIMGELAAQGVAIVLISSDMPELVSMSDRVLVISSGKITGELIGEDITQKNVMKAAIA
ncbi:MAG: sugar ABC transporter ATP-binding protein [Clostridiales bacterium]|nr:sugar ABC transporter ATP-binding protein [Clostridiales bacterium]